jgi:hypothetical protein
MQPSLRRGRRLGRFHAMIGIALSLTLALAGSGVATAKSRDANRSHWKTPSGDLLDLAAVRFVSSRFASVNQAIAEGYVLFYKCTEQPGVGTMGQHFVNLDYVGDPSINPLRPEVLVYEPKRNGGYELAAVEYVTIAADWHAAFGDGTPTVLGQDMLFRAAGNRYGLPDFYERHAWLFKFNPSGTFEDWNPRMSCRGTGDNGG